MKLLEVIEKNMYIAFRKQLQKAVLSADGRKIAIWGAGVRGIIAGTILEELGVEEYIYIDSDPQRIGQTLSGHEIVSFMVADKEKPYIILSMEYSEPIKDVCLKHYDDKRDFTSLYVDEYKRLIDKLQDKNKRNVLVLGESILNVIPWGERKENSLAEEIESISNKTVKVMGSSCLGMELLYYLAYLELYHCEQYKEVILLIDFRSLTSYNHYLPRIQKPDFAYMLEQYATQIGAIQVAKELGDSYQIRLQRMNNYEFENRHSPKRMDGDSSLWMKQYLDDSVMEELHPECDEIKWLHQLIRMAYQKKIQTKLVFQPMNIEYCRKIYDESFNKMYIEKKRKLEEMVAQYNVTCIDAGDFLNTEEFVVCNTPNDALRKNGRKIFAKYILEVASLREEH